MDDDNGSRQSEEERISAEQQALREAISARQVRLRALRARKAVLTRKRDAHCKIMIAGAILSMVDCGDEDAKIILQSALNVASRSRNRRDADEIERWLTDRETRARNRPRRAAPPASFEPVAPGAGDGPAVPGGESS